MADNPVSTGIDESQDSFDGVYGAKADVVFEVSWEVCNKVGGIYTVVKSKAGYMTKSYSNYFLVGPYFIKKAHGEFIEEMPPEDIKQVFQKLKPEGIDCHYGKWLIDGQPRCILLDFTGFTKTTNDIKKRNWDNYSIDSLNTQYFDYDEPVVWSTAAGRLIEELSYVWKDKKIVAQFHEWLCASGLLHLKKAKAKVGTVFTTHATILGRTIASSHKDLYSIYAKIDPVKEAYNYGIQAKYLTEMEGAKNADIFTTVSEITGMEAEHLLKKKPDVILPNGLDVSKFPGFEDASIKHKMFKRKIYEFLVYYFFPYYEFDLLNTLIFFLCGRYEFHDKGIDVFIKALGKLNGQMKSKNSEKTVVAFFWVPGNVRGVKPDLLENQYFYKDIKDSVDDEISDIRAMILKNLVSQTEITKESIFSEDFRSEVNVKVLKFKKAGSPPLSTHDLFDEQNDEILNAFKKNGLNNRKEDKVKVVFYSTYLTGADGLLDTSYYESMLGGHLGVFPSYYEPWGYTPLEGAALSVASVTTDLSGFGRFVCSNCSPEKQAGVYVLKRMGVSDDEFVNSLAETLYHYTLLTKSGRINNKIKARNLAAMADWRIFVKNYVDAHNAALDKVYG